MVASLKCPRSLPNIRILKESASEHASALDRANLEPPCVIYPKVSLRVLLLSPNYSSFLALAAPIH